MITRQEALLMGVNAPKQHQRVIRRIIANLDRLFEIEGAIMLEPFPETMLDESQPSATPDIMLYDNVLEVTPIILEVTHSNGVTGDFRKVSSLIDEGDYGIIEGFVYNYKRNEWHKYKRGIGHVLEKPSFCDVINIDLTTLL
jgi:hypothetical protein